MEPIVAPKREMALPDKVNFATEVAFNALIGQAQQMGVPLTPVMGLMYLPDQAVTRQFQETCRAVLGSLRPAAPSITRLPK